MRKRKVVAGESCLQEGPGKRTEAHLRSSVKASVLEATLEGGWGLDLGLDPEDMGQLCKGLKHRSDGVRWVFYEKW